MRRIKFRGKRIDGKGWIRNSYTLVQDGDGTWLHDNDVEKIDENTLGQFTGLCDKSEKEIYEHDLVECAGVLCEVVYSDKIGSFVLLEVLSQNLGNKPIGQMIDMFGIRYVGNIYDSPELLK